MRGEDLLLLTGLKEPHHLMYGNVKGKREWAAGRAVSALITKTGILLALLCHEIDEALVIGQRDIDGLHNPSLLKYKNPPGIGINVMADFRRGGLEKIRSDYTKKKMRCK
jgi:hypothetical protein